MSYLKRSLKCYLPFALNEVKVAMSYRISFFIALFSRAFTVFVTYCLWSAIYASSQNKVLGGFTLKEMTAYVIISFFTSTLVSSEGSKQIAFEIVDGSIAMNLLKPINYRSRFLSMSVGIVIVTALTSIFPFIILFSLLGLLPFYGLNSIFLYCLSTLLSFLLLYIFGFCFSMIAFYTTYFFGINMAKDVFIKFFSGAMIPLTFFPKEIASLFKILPFASMNYTPVMIYLNKLTRTQIIHTLGLQLFWIIFFCFLSNMLWQYAIKRLTILGG